jgi:Family of unknown function (DUF5941)/CDP-alcohol phosphatidyltransferase
VISLLAVRSDPSAAPAALLPLGPATVLDSALQRLARLGAPVTSVITLGAVDEVRAAVAGGAATVAAPDLATALRSVAASLTDADTDVAIVAADLLLPDEALAELLLDPRRRTSAMVGGSAGVGSGAEVRRRSGQVVSAGSANHRVVDPDAAFTGAVLIARKDLLGAADAVRAMAEVAGDNGWSGTVPEHVLVALVRRQVPVAAVDLDPWPWWRVTAAAEVDRATEVMGGTDPAAVRLARALRPDDGFYSTFVVRRISRRLTPLAIRWGLRPNPITIASLVIGLAAAAAFATGERTGLVAGALLLQLSLVVDCVDGEVARYTRAFSSLGAWLDASTDRVKEYACYAGLAYGAGGGGVWLLAAAMLTLQTTRHTSDYTFTLVKNLRESSLQSMDLDRSDDGTGDATVPVSAAERAVRASQRSNERPWVNWTKKAIHLPIGERWLVISLVAAAGTPRLVFQVLLALGLAALAYTTTGRVLRARTWAELAGSELERDVIRAQLDRGPLAALIARVVPWQLPVGRYAWTVPPLLRFFEYAVVLLVVRAVAPDAVPAAFALLFAVAYHHYDALYRVLNGLPPAGAVHAAGLGVEGRLIAILVLAAAGEDALSRGLVVMAVALAVVFVVVGTMGGLRALRPGPDGAAQKEEVRA